MKEVITLRFTTTQLNQLVVTCKVGDAKGKVPEFVQVYDDAEFFDYPEIKEYLNRIVASLNNMDYDPSYRLSSSDAKKVLKC